MIHRGHLDTPIDEAHLAAIGRVTVNFALLEYQLAAAIWAALGTDLSSGRVVTAQLSFGRMLALLDSLARLRLEDDQRLADLKGILARASNAETIRNHLLHSTWIAGPPNQEPFRMKATATRGKGLQVQGEAMPAPRIHEIARDISAAAFEMVEVQHWFARGEP